MRIKIFLIFFLLSSSISAQELDFMRIEPKAVKSSDEIMELKIRKVLEFENYQFIIGYCDDTLIQNSGLRLFIKGPSNKIIFRSKGQQDSFYFEPYIFFAQEFDQFIMVCEIGAEYSWGAIVFLVDGENVTEMGPLDVGIIDLPISSDEVKYREPRRINKYLKVTFNQGVWKFKFQENITAVVNPGGNDTLIPSEDIHYIWDGEMKRITKK